MPAPDTGQCRTTVSTREPAPPIGSDVYIPSGTVDWPSPYNIGQRSAGRSSHRFQGRGRMTDFLAKTPTLDANWRAVVLFGWNAACYKFSESGRGASGERRGAGGSCGCRRATFPVQKAQERPEG